MPATARRWRRSILRWRLGARRCWPGPYARWKRCSTVPTSEPSPVRAHSVYSPSELLFDGRPCCSRPGCGGRWWRSGWRRGSAAGGVAQRARRGAGRRRHEHLELHAAVSCGAKGRRQPEPELALIGWLRMAIKKAFVSHSLLARALLTLVVRHRQLAHTGQGERRTVPSRARPANRIVGDARAIDRGH